MEIKNVQIKHIDYCDYHRFDVGDLDTLAADIKAQGLLLPIGVSTKGELIWGLRRLLACDEILKWEEIPARVLDIESVLEYRLSESLALELSLSEKVALVDSTRIYAHGGNRTGGGGPRLADICKSVGLSDDTYYRAKRVCESEFGALVEAMDNRLISPYQAALLTEEPEDIVQECLSRLPNATLAERRSISSTIKKIKRNENVAETVEPLPDPQDETSEVRLYHCEFQRLAEVAGLKPASANAIVSHLPNGKDFLQELEDLANFAENYLTEGGILVANCETKYLPRFMEALSKRLDYVWMILSSNQPTVDVRRTTRNGTKYQVRSEMMPILIFSKGKPNYVKSFDDLIEQDQAQLLDDWQRQVNDAEYLLECFTQTGDLVVDPCGGSFTTAAACFRTFRRFVGCDKQRNCVVTGLERLKRIKEEPNVDVVKNLLIEDDETVYVGFKQS